MIEIRALGKSDLEEFWQLRLRALKEEPESFAASYEESVEMLPADIEKRLENSNNAFVLGAFTPKLAGMIGFYRRQGLKVKHKGVIWGMYVAPESRTQGLGKALILSTVELASKFGDVEELLLTVGAQNKSAHRLYSACGFKSYSVEPGALKLGDRYFNDEWMALKLNQKL